MRKNNSYWLFTVIAVVLFTFGVYEFYNARAYRQSLEDTYNRAFFELTDYVDDIDTLLAKGLVATSAGEMATISQELSVQASAAKACLAQLPITEVQLDKTEKFLSQVGDYTYTLSQSLINKNTISEQEYESLSSLGSYATTLNQSLGDLSKNVYNGTLRFGSNAKISPQRVVYAAEEDPFSAIEKKFGEYPSLIYDGPFSEHIENRSPKLLENARAISKDEAAKKIADRFDVDVKSVAFAGETENSNMDSYLFKFPKNGGEVCVSLTKKGGYTVYFLENRRIHTEKLSVEDAIKKAQDFLAASGYDNMQNSYYEKQGGVATVNFAYKQNNVTCYSDLIKVKVALDNGEIIGMEANGYIMNHSKRDIRTPALSKQQARAKVSSKVNIDTVNIALIPKDSAREVLCYEFKGTAAGRNFLIYINAETGGEEDIQILIESPDGILTI
ncbi:MAG: germination protein YpeB [Clostridiales bacterium]|nr:germination protein YpeB [Clostridiales bacterium]